MTFDELENKIENLSAIKGVDTSIIGHSVCGKPIYAFHVGEYCNNQIIITGAIHAREWITALLVAELVKICGVCDMQNSGCYFIPLCNPDGVQIALGGKSLWKANARGVDLNVNFDADWGLGAQNVFQPGPENYIGPYPNSEPEVQALIKFTQEVKPQITVAYHSKGEVIYYGFESSDGRITKKQLLLSRLITKKIGEVTGYIPTKTENSTGGYSDWVSMHLGVPALTIEAGNDDYSHPIGTDKLPEILEQNKCVPSTLLSFARLLNFF